MRDFALFFDTVLADIFSLALETGLTYFLHFLLALYLIPTTIMEKKSSVVSTYVESTNYVPESSLKN